MPFPALAVRLRRFLSAVQIHRAALRRWARRPAPTDGACELTLVSSVDVHVAGVPLTTGYELVQTLRVPSPSAAARNGVHDARIASVRAQDGGRAAVLLNTRMDARLASLVRSLPAPLWLPASTAPLTLSGRLSLALACACAHWH